VKKANWNLWFYLPFFFSLGAGGVLLSAVQKGDDVLFVNGLHSLFLDNLFYYGTTLGDGMLYLIVAVALLWKNIRHALVAFACFSLTGILIQVLKKIVFFEMMRPAAMLGDEPLHFVEGLKILKMYSFPSGHAAMAFSMFCLLSQLVRARWFGFIFLVLALTAGVSRVYLVQHFFVDVFFGAILGVSVTSMVWLWFSQKPVLQQWSGKTLLFYFRRA